MTSNWLRTSLLAAALALAAVARADVNATLESCAGCHGKDGASTESDVPIIAGYSAEYIKYALESYKKKERPCPETKVRAGAKKGTKTDMCREAKELSEAEIKDVAKHFAGKKFVRAQQKFDAALAAKGKQIHEDNCEKCHSNGGSVASDDAGILAGQWMPYLEETFKQYSAGKRPMEQKMKPKIEKLNKAAFDALVNYYGSFK